MWTTKVDSSSTSANKLSKCENLKNSYGNVCGCITAILRCPFPAASASAVHSEIPVTPAHTCSDLSGEKQIVKFNGKQFRQFCERYSWSYQCRFRWYCSIAYKRYQLHWYKFIFFYVCICFQNIFFIITSDISTCFQSPIRWV